MTNPLGGSLDTTPAEVSQVSREALDAVLLRQLLADALRSCRFKRLPDHLPVSKGRSFSHGPVEWLFVAWWADIALLREVAGFPWWLAVLAPAVLVTFAGALPDGWLDKSILALTVVLLPLAGFVYSVFFRDDLLLVAYAIPAAVSVVAALIYRLAMGEFRDIAGIVAGVTRGAPLAAPLVLVFLLFPLMSRDIWEIAAGLTTRNLGWFALLTIVVTFAIVYIKLRSEIRGVTTESIRTAAQSPTRSSATRAAIERTLRRRKESRNVLEAISDESIDAWWPADPSEYEPFLSAIESRALIKPLKFRLAITTGAFVLFLFAYVYAIASLGIPDSTIDGWLGGKAEITEFHGVDLHTGAYVKVAALFAVIGTAGFLSFSVIEDRFSTAMTAALLRRPVERYVGLSLPFIGLDEAIGDLDYWFEIESDDEPN